MANTYRESGNYEKAVAMYEEYLGKGTWREERFFARYYLARSLDKLGRRREAKVQLFHAMGEDGRFAEAYCMMGDIEAAEGNLSRASLWFRMALATPFPDDALLFVARDMYGSYPRSRLAQIGKDADVVEKHDGRMVKRFMLPDDKSSAMWAVAALDACAASDPGCRFVVVASDENVGIVKASERLELGDGDAPTLSLPDDLRGRHRAEWYCRSAGYVLGMDDLDPRVVGELKRRLKDAG